MTTNYPDDLVSELEASLLGRNDIINRWANAISSILMLPGLRGCWPMSSIVGGPTIPPGGNANDLSGNGLTLTYNGNPTYNVFNGFVPYIDLDGTGDFLSRADTGANDPLDILGTETYIASALRGLTLGGWFWIDTLASTEQFIGKLGVSGQFSYRVAKNAGDNVVSQISVDGTAIHSTISSGTISTGTWFFSAGRFDPSIEGAIFLNNVKTVNVASVPASIFNSTAEFRIGNDDGGFGQLLDGRASLCWLCAASLPDATIRGLFEQQRVLFNV